MRSPDERLEHDGVRLRRWRSDDVDPLFRAVRESIEHLSPWMTWATDDFDRAGAAVYLARSEADWRDGNAYNYAVIAPDGTLAGSCGLMARIGPGGLEIGYWLHPRHTGQGIATRAAAALTAEALRIGADRVEIVTDVANQRSAAIPRRLGFVEAERRTDGRRATPARQGVDIIWRYRAPDRPAP
jgi:RimJ/RimL family protein N-acetyltransferase